jgi:isopenicillin-N N-acyltransferase like protein
VTDGAPEVRVVVAEGDAVARGRTVGRALGDMIERSIGFYHSYFERRGVASHDLQDLLAPYLAAAETALPDDMATIKAMAEGAMVPVWELFAVNAFEEVEPLLTNPEGKPRFLQRDVGVHRPRPGRCSSLAVSGEGYTLIGHNEQWLAGDQGNVAVIIDYPAGDRPAVASPTVVCCLPAVGMNANRIAQAIESVTARDDGEGVPRVMVSRYSLEARNGTDALRRATLPGRAGGYGHVFAMAGGETFAVETTGTTHRLLPGPVAHTNHYLDPDLAALAPEPSPGSLGRQARLSRLIAERNPSTPQAVMDILRDHESRPQAICLHPDEAEGDEAAAVVFSMVCDVDTGRMWVASGNPCTSPYQEIDLVHMLAAGQPWSWEQT